MSRRAWLNGFLRTHRPRIRPEDVGLPLGNGHRRVPGLRREEVAQLAGVSVDYYSRLEQGRCPNVSDSVLDAVARAFRLTDDKRTHLGRSARPANHAAARERPQVVRPGRRLALWTCNAAPHTMTMAPRRCDISARLQLPDTRSRNHR